VRQVSKTFQAQRALRGIGLDIKRGEIHALVGQNGSGKSTFVKILAGYHKPDGDPAATVNGRKFQLGNAASAHSAGVRFVHQDLGVIDAMSVVDNFVLGTPESGLVPIKRRAERRTTRAALANLGYDFDVTKRVQDLAEAEKTAIVVARALDHAEGIPLLVLDEPTAALPKADAERLFSALRSATARGTAILFISHHLEEILSFADVVTVLRDGERITTMPVADCDQDQLVELMLGRRLLAETLQHVAVAPAQCHEQARLEADKICGKTVVQASFSVRAGSILGVAGLTGSGREELAGLLTGQLPRGGRVLTDGKELPPGEPRASVVAGVCCVHGDRAAKGLLTGASVRENLTIGNLGSLARGGTLRPKVDKAEAQKWLTKLDVRPPSTEKAINELSGGNQQKVMLARWLRTKPTVLVLDEPTQGVDVGAKAEIHALVRTAASQGAAIVVCSSDSEELSALADEVLVMRAGHIRARLIGKELSPTRIDQAQLVVDGLKQHNRVKTSVQKEAEAQ
jgi:ribose transport system ATP-binding protein